MAERKFQVGQRVWKFDINHRVYPKPPPGRIWASGGPIYAEHFRPRKVVGIEKRCYVVTMSADDPTRTTRVGFAKAERELRTDSEREAQIWMRDHRYKLELAVSQCSDIDVLKRIAELVGYKAE